MQEIKIKKIHLENVRKLGMAEGGTLDLYFHDGTNPIIARNGAGKTSVLDAVLFALVGKLMSGSADVGTLKPNFDPQRHVVVELTLSKEGTDTVFRKELFERWTTTRGTTTQVYTGDETKCAIDGIAKGSNDYDALVMKYFGLPTLEWVQMLVDTKYAANMESKKLRKILTDITGSPDVLQILGKVTGADLIIDKVRPENGILNFTKPIDFEALDNAKGKVAIDVRAKDEAKKTAEISAKAIVISKIVSEEEYIAACQKITSLTNEETSLNAAKARLVNPKVEALKKQLEAFKSSLNECNAADNRALLKANEVFQKKAKEIQDQLDALHGFKRTAVDEQFKITGEIAKLEKENTTDRSIVLSKTAERGQLADQWDAIDAEKFIPDESHLCPQCGFDLTADHNALKLEAFNASKSSRLAALETKGNEIFRSSDSLTKAIAEREGKIKELKAQELTAKEKVVPFEDQIRTAEKDKSAETAKISYNAAKSEATIQCEQDIDAATLALETAKREPVDDNGISARLAEIAKDKEAATAVQVDYRVMKSLEKQKHDNEVILANAAEALAAAQSREGALKEFERLFLEDIQNRQKAKFPRTNIRLVKPAKVKANSWEADCTIVNDKGIAYPTLSTSEKNIIGLGFILDLRDAMGYPAMPILNDDVEHIDADRIQQVFSVVPQSIVAIVGGESIIVSDKTGGIAS